MVAPTVALLLVLAIPDQAQPEVKRLSVFREVTLLSGVAASAIGCGFAVYGIWKREEWAAIPATALIVSGSIFSLGTMFTTHRWEQPPLWVFIVGPILGVVSGAAALITTILVNPEH